MWHVCGTGELRTGFWWRDMMEIDHMEDLRVGGRIILKLIFKQWDREAWTGLLWLRIGTAVGLL